MRSVVVAQLENDFDFGLAYPWTTSFVFTSLFEIVALLFPIMFFSIFFLSSPSSPS
jgi:hypothetical protein